MALAADLVRKMQYPQPIIRNLNVAAAETIYKGAIVAIDAAGDAIAAPAAQNEEFVGIAEESYDNSAGAITTGNPLQVRCSGLVEMTLAAVTDADLGKAVYYVDDETGTVTAPADKTTRVGTVARVISATVAMVNLSNNWESSLH